MKPTGPLLVLVVEDSPLYAEMVGKILSRTRQFEVKTAGSLRAGLECLKGGEVDIVLLDLSLPDSAGLETFRHIQNAAPQVPIIVLTGLDDESLATSTVTEGAQDYLVKGDFEAPTLIRAIRYAIERHRIRRALDEERKFTRTLLEGIPDRMYFKDRQSRFVRINRLLADVLDLDDSTEALGKTDFDFFQTDHAQEAFDEEEQVMRTGEPLVDKVEREVLLNGQSTWLLTTKMPVRDAAGQIVGIFGVSRDITELKRAEEALRLSEKRFRGLLERVMDYNYTVHLRDGQAVATVHGEGCLAVTGYTRQEYEADQGLWARMIHPDDLPKVVENFERLLAGGTALPVEHRVVHKDGSIRWIRNTPAPHFDEQRRLTSYEAVVADITERKEAEQQLTAANVRLRELVAELTRSHRGLQNAQLELIDAAKMQSVGQLAAGVAHEVKNPLAILLLGLDCISDHPASKDPGLVGILGEMQVAVDRASTVITGLLDFSASKNLELNDCDLNEIVGRSLEYVRHLLVQGKVNVVRDLGENLPRGLMDARKIEQVFVNLFTNACHAMPGGGLLTVRTGARTLGPNDIPREAGDRSGLRLGAGDEVLTVEVQDTGTGIPEDKISRIFDPFFTTKPTGQGTGLGLAVTRSIIELHGGTIEASNRPEGGVTVTVILRCGSL
ncbi:MAG: hypothetical protein QOE70_2158 [Chthoniobacter sp.]|jgi:PAS domain S-box-containing protein|nr:hypothetical protein [Chthoniobacter sp.]